MSFKLNRKLFTNVGFALVFAVLYFTLWRVFRVFLMSSLLLPLAVSTANEPMAVYKGNSTVNMIVVRTDFYEQALSNAGISNTTGDQPVTQEGMVSSREKFIFYFKSPGDVWLLLAGTAILAAGGGISLAFALLGFHLLTSTIGYLFLLLGVKSWVPALFVFDIFGSFIIPAGSMLFVIWVIIIKNKSNPFNIK
jgi:hypothetical protein